MRLIYHCPFSNIAANNSTHDCFNTENVLVLEKLNPVSNLSMVYDSNNYLHISYFQEDELIYKYQTSTGWSSSILIANNISNGDNDLAIDSNGYKHITYTIGNKLIHTTTAPHQGVNVWKDTEFNLSSTSYILTSNSMVLDSSDNVHIICRDESKDIFYLFINISLNLTYGPLQIDNGSISDGNETSIAIDSNDRLHISHQWNGNLTYGLFDGGPYFTLFNPFNNGLNSYNFLHDIDGSNVGTDNSIAVDSQNKVHMAYCDVANQMLKHASATHHPNGSINQVTISNVGPMLCGSGTSIAIDSSDNIYISYYHDSNSSLMQSVKQNSIWSHSVISTSSNNDVINSTLMINEFDSFYTFFQNQTTLSGEFATNQKGPCLNQSIIDQTGNNPSSTLIGNPICGVLSGIGGRAIELNISQKVSIDTTNWQDTPAASVAMRINVKNISNISDQLFSPLNNDEGIYLSLQPHSSDVKYYHASCHLGNNSNVSSYYNLNFDQYYNLLCTYDGEYLTIYVDGWVPRSTLVTVPNNVMWNSSSAFIEGQSNVLIDNFAYWDYAIEQYQALLLFTPSFQFPSTLNNTFPVKPEQSIQYKIELDLQSNIFNATNVSIFNSTIINCTFPSSSPLHGFADVIIGDYYGNEFFRLVNGFEYILPPDFDGDGWLDEIDAFPFDSTQWLDSDGDGYGDNLTGNNSDTFPLDSTQWNDTDGDGYGDNQSGNNPDIYPNEPSQWSDSDGDGYGDNSLGFEGDAFPTEPSQWNDTDGDGYGDNQSGFQPDDCISIWGNSTIDRFGCPDNDGDGISNDNDAFPEDPTRSQDTDQDGFDDIEDNCISIVGNSTQDRLGCPDLDGDGYSDITIGNDTTPGWNISDGADAFPNEASQWNDTDGDGYGDNTTGFEGDQCPLIWGNSTIGGLGCPDNDGDGLSNYDDPCPDSNFSIGELDTDGDGCFDQEDIFPNDANESQDSDDDGIGDNSDPEPFVPLDTDGDGFPDRQGYFDSDDCIEVWGNSTTNLLGCLDSDGDGLADTEDDFPFDSNRTLDADGDQFDDIIEDDCLNQTGNSTIDLLGCPDMDGDGVSDQNDQFPADPSEWNDADGDGIGDNSDAFPQDASETLDSDGDGVGDNSDIFPLDFTESMDSDGDGIGDNSDPYPLQNNFIDTDDDGILDIEDAFPNDETQWFDSDGDGYGDNQSGNQPDKFTSDNTQWSDTDGDGYGDNWGSDEWNLTRLFIWPGTFVEGARNADHCPAEWGNSSANMYFGCPDTDFDGVADQYDNYVGIGGGEEVSQEEIDSDGDGVSDTFDLCPNSLIDEYVDIDGCIIDRDNDGVDDLRDQCPNTNPNTEVNVEGCSVSLKEEQSFVEELFSGDQDTFVKTVGMGAIIIAVIGFLQTNFIAALLPDAFRWVQVFRKNSKLSIEEEMELRHLQSIVQAYFKEPEILTEELNLLKSDISARFTNKEIKKETREIINILITDLTNMDVSELSRIAQDDNFFGLAGTIDVEERDEKLEIEIKTREIASVQDTNNDLDEWKD